MQRGRKSWGEAPSRERGAEAQVRRPARCVRLLGLCVGPARGRPFSSVPSGAWRPGCACLRPPTSGAPAWVDLSPLGVLEGRWAQQGHLSSSWPSISLSDSRDPSSPTEARSQVTRHGQSGARPRPAHANLHSSPRKRPASPRPALSLRPKCLPDVPTSPCGGPSPLFTCSACCRTSCVLRWPGHPQAGRPLARPPLHPVTLGHSQTLLVSPRAAPGIPALSPSSGALASSDLPRVPSALLPPLSQPSPAHASLPCPRQSPRSCLQPPVLPRTESFFQRTGLAPQFEVSDRCPCGLSNR